MRSATPESGELGELPDEAGGVIEATGPPPSAGRAGGAARRSRSRSPLHQRPHSGRRARSRSRSPRRDAWAARHPRSPPDDPHWRHDDRRRRSRSRSPRDRDRGQSPDYRWRAGHHRSGRDHRSPPRPRSPSLSPVDDEALAARAEAALAGDEGDEEAEAAAAAAARAARRAAILARHGDGGGEPAPAAPPQPPPPAADAGDDDGMAAADPDADGIGERRPVAAAAVAATTTARPAPVPLDLARGGGAAAGTTAAARAPTPDMFGDDDAFAAQPTTTTTDAAPAHGPALADAFDDAEGYYRARVGEVIAGRYEVTATLGAGVFATVVRARDSGVPTEADPSPPVPRDDAADEGGGGGLEEGAHRGGARGGGGEAALKIIRANDLMARAAALEASILRKLGDADPGGRRHCVRLLSTFEHRGHAVLAFPAAAEGNLRALAKKYGRGVGLALPAVRAYTAQLLLALAHCRNCGVIHADVKPDNILVERGAASVLLADFGSAMWSGGGNALTPYLASRFYRPPEVVLGLPYDHPVDAWAVGCVAAELYTGRILFPGGSNNEMLALFQEARGALPPRMVKKGAFAWKHFEGVAHPGAPPPPPGAPLVFARQTVDKVTGRPARVLVPHPQATRPLAARLAGGGGDRRDVAAFADLLDRLLALDPDRRISPREALKHHFITGVEPERGGGGGRKG